jgi:virginiamycin A acetyltransferase
VTSDEHHRQGLLRSVAEKLGDAMILPAVVALRARLVAFTTVGHGLALVPGAFGRLMRRAWYRQTLAACGRNLVVDFGAAIRTQKSRIGDNCYIGIYNWFGWVNIGDDFMSGSHVVVLSGRRQHHFDRLDVPMRAQAGEQSCVSIGDDVWVGAGAVISADVAPHTIVASGAVVQKTFSDHDILGGVPAKQIGSRRSLRADAVAEPS